MKVLNTSIPEPLMRELKAFVALRGISISTAAAEAVSLWVEQHKQEAARVS